MRRSADYRAPMWSRLDSVDRWAAVERARSLDLCGVGGRLPEPPAGLATAVRDVETTYDDRLARRLQRFAAVADVAVVWTLWDDGRFCRGVLDGPWRYDASPEAWAVDLCHVRPCRWDAPLDPHRAPSAVVASYGRGGRNFQRIRPP